MESCEISEYRRFMELLLYSGIRTTEAQRILENFDEKRLHFVGAVAYYDIEWSRGSRTKRSCRQNLHRPCDTKPTSTFLRSRNISLLVGWD
ncbi:integrase [Methanococcoides seepicolus]|uniref:integrase n=1 Tax=Methanococcoides seepicolus TaxID=2828780 RepID=UPI003B849F61